MSLHEAVFLVTKRIHNNPAREIVCDVIKSLRQSRGDEGFGDFDYAARQQHAQLGGYLAVDDNLERINQSSTPFKIFPLPADARSKLESAHREIVKLNLRCLRFLSPDCEPCRIALDPYQRFSIKERTSDEGFNLLSDEDINTIGDEFSQIKPVMRLLSKTPKGLEHLGADKIYAATHHIKTQVLTAGVGSTPSDIVDLLRDNSASVQALMGKFILDLIAVFSVLEIIDQLIYQSVINDSLLIINEDSIMSFGPESSHRLGSGLEIECQPSSNLFFDAVGTVVLVDSKTDPVKMHKFFRVDGATISFSKEQGNSVKFKMRQLNEDLNPYSGLDRN